MSLPIRFRPAKIKPSTEQIDIQTSAADTMLIPANAGAAKTTTLALCIGQALNSGVAPHRIRSLTYTKPAREAMHKALVKMAVPAMARKALEVQTFDEFSAEMLLSIEKRKVAFMATHEDVAPYVREAARRLQTGIDSEGIERFLTVSRRLKGTLAWDKAAWNGEGLIEQFADEIGIESSQLKLFQAYEDIRYPKRDGVDLPKFRWEFDATYDLARILADPDPNTYLNEVLDWPLNLDLLLVDEMHDLNASMFEIVRRLLDSNPQAHFRGVGDVDQVIHGTAGAEQRFMDRDIDLGQRHVRVFPLTASHRFGRRIAAAAGHLAEKKYASAAQHESNLVCRMYPDQNGRGCEELILNAVTEWKSSAGGNISDVAILLRHPWQSVAVENALVRAGMSYSTRGFTRYLLQPEVLVVRALLAVAAGDYQQLQSEETIVALMRAVVFFCGVTLGHEVSENETQGERLQSAIRHVTRDRESLHPFIEFQVLARAEPALGRRMRAAIAVAEDRHSEIGWFDQFLDALDVHSWVGRVFVERQRRADALAYFDGLKTAARSYRSPKDFFDSLGENENALKATFNEQKLAARAATLRRNTLTLARIEDVKGLEYDHVVMPYLEQGQFPAALSASKREERNLFYVGITRARKQLTLLGPSDRLSEFVIAARAEAT